MTKRLFFNARWIACVFTAATAALLATPATAQDKDVTLEPRTVEAFVDGLIEPSMAASGVPGVIIAIVAPDRDILVKGYGIADLETGAPVTVDRTLFNIASIGKTMTAVVASQLIDEGLIDPDTDVNTYLDGFEVSGGTVTLNMLLAHRAGFDPDLSFLFVDLDQNTAMTNGALNRRLTLLQKPGIVSSYDNLGFGLVGLVAESVTGETLDTLLRNRIFAPLSMNATYGQATSDNFDLARCYVPKSPDEIIECDNLLYKSVVKGAGGAFASAQAMARYMRMLLNEGELDGTQMLSQRAFRELLNFSTNRFHEDLPGIGRSFFEFRGPAGQSYGHGGSMPGFSSNMRLYPDLGIGVFVSYMGGQASSFDAILSRLLPHLSETSLSAEVRAAQFTLGGIPEAFIEHFFVEDVTDDNVAPVAGMPGRVADDAITGAYYPVEGASRNLMTRILRWTAPFKVKTVSNDAISLNGQGPFVRIAPMIYMDEGGTRIVFKPIGQRLFVASGVSIATFERLSWWQAPGWSLPVAGLCFLVVISAALFMRQRYTKRGRRAALIICGAVFIFLISLGLELEYRVLLTIVHGDVVLPVMLRLVLLISLFAMVAGSGLLTWTVVGNTEPSQQNRAIPLIHSTCISAAALALFVIAVLWGLLSI